MLTSDGACRFNQKQQQEQQRVDHTTIECAVIYTQCVSAAAAAVVCLLNAMLKRTATGK